jgi:hypothetical protein
MVALFCHRKMVMNQAVAAIYRREGVISIAGCLRVNVSVAGEYIGSPQESLPESALNTSRTAHLDFPSHA